MIEFENTNDALDHVRKNSAKLQIMESAVDPEIQQDFNARLDRMTETELDQVPEEVLQLALENSLDTLSDRDWLIRLAAILDPAALRLIEKLIEHNHDNPDILPFAKFCHDMLTMRLISHLSGESVGFVAGGLGGRNSKLRHFFLVFPLGDAGFTASQIKLTTDEFRDTVEALGGECETFESTPEYVAVTALLPLEDIFEEITNRCLTELAQYGNFIFPGMFTTNVTIPTYPEILDIIKEMRKEREAAKTAAEEDEEEADEENI